MKLGATDITAVYLGGTPITAAYLGDEQVWSAPILITTSDDPAAVVAASPAGSTFVFEAGEYRITQTIVPRNGDTFIGAPDHATVLNGSRLLTAWTQDGGVWKATGQTQAGEVHGQCDTDHPRCGYPEELFIDDVRQKHVATAGEVGPGTWHFDYPNDTIIIGEDPAGKKIETSVTTYAFRSANNNVTIKGVVIEKFANLAQRGVIYPEQPLGTVGEGWAVEDCIIRNNHGAGLSPRDGGVVRNCLITQNGQIGMSAVGADILIEDNEISYNNAAKFAYGWEGGGAKFVNTTNLIVRGNYSHHNYGPGLWTDIDNVDSLYEDNIVEDNFDTGIFHEISYDAIIRNNTIRRNGLGRGLAQYAWAFGAGIAIYNSSNVEVYGNTLEGNHGGITCISHPRGSGAYGDWHLKNISIHDNEVQLLYHENGLNWDSNPGVYAHNGVFQDNSPTDVFDPAANIVFAANAYTTSPGRIAGAYFGWLNGFRTFTQWTTTYGQDAGATIEEMPP